ncbi:MAG: hypothetical protein F6K11_32530 [Leptolyngbya sp. SIO3F4]|nr:hypothetical protein [Leptolyngbya sp. SIO3F4]
MLEAPYVFMQFLAISTTAAVADSSGWFYLRNSDLLHLPDWCIPLNQQWSTALD